jgi:hypothetical protein
VDVRKRGVLGRYLELPIWQTKVFSLIISADNNAGDASATASTICHL